MDFGVKERILIVLCDDMPAATCASEVAALTDLAEEDVQAFINQALAEGFIVAYDIPDGDENESRYFFTNKVVKESIDDDARVVRDDFLGGENYAAAAAALKKKLKPFVRT